MVLVVVTPVVVVPVVVVPVVVVAVVVVAVVVVIAVVLVLSSQQLFPTAPDLSLYTSPIPEQSL